MVIKDSYENGQFAWVDVVAQDMATLQDFYTKLFGWQVETVDTQGGPPYARFHLDGQPVAGLGQMTPEMKSQGVPAAWNSYVNTDDIQAATSQAAESGGTLIVPVMQVLDAGWVAFVQDPTGANIGLWQKSQHIGAGRIGDPGTLCWNELATRDAEAAQQFYKQVFGWEFEHFAGAGAPAPYYLIKNGGQMNGGLMQMAEEWGNVPSFWAVYFAVDDIEQAVADLQKCGGTLTISIMDTPAGRMAVAADPQQATFSMIQLEQQAG